MLTVHICQRNLIILFSSENVEVLNLGQKNVYMEIAVRCLVKTNLVYVNCEEWKEICARFAVVPQLRRSGSRCDQCLVKTGEALHVCMQAQEKVVCVSILFSFSIHWVFDTYPTWGLLHENQILVCRVLLYKLMGQFYNISL